VGLSLPNDDFWVNLRPDSPDEMINADLARTDVGRILLEADVQLKKDTAAATSPKTPAGKAYWDKLYQKAESLYGSENITIPTLTRPWIVPDEIIVREAQGSAYIYKATLKVMLEQDYLKNSASYSFPDEKSRELNEYSSQIIRETIIPKLTKEINSSKRYAGLRQVYYSLILAQWFKAKYQGNNGIYSRRIDSKDLTDLTSKTNWDKDTYFKAYQKSFKDGEYNIKENRNTVYGQTIRSYFSGGISFGSDSAGGGIARCIEAGLIAASRMREFSGEHAIAANVGADGGITIEEAAVRKPQEDGGKVILDNGDYSNKENPRITRALILSGAVAQSEGGITKKEPFILTKFILSLQAGISRVLNGFRERWSSPGKGAPRKYSASEGNTNIGKIEVENDDSFVDLKRYIHAVNILLAEGKHVQLAQFVAGEFNKQTVERIVGNTYSEGSVRLEVDIVDQNRDPRSQGVYEAVANSLDAMGFNIGQFGKGVKQVIDWLAPNGRDKIEVYTAAEAGNALNLTLVKAPDGRIFIKIRKIPFAEFQRAAQTEGVTGLEHGTMLRIVTAQNIPRTNEEMDSARPNSQRAIMDGIHKRFPFIYSVDISTQIGDNAPEEVNGFKNKIRIVPAAGRVAEKDMRTKGRIRVRSTDHSITIVDDGSGMEEEVLGRMFVPRAGTKTADTLTPEKAKEEISKVSIVHDATMANRLSFARNGEVVVTVDVPAGIAAGAAFAGGLMIELGLLLDVQESRDSVIIPVNTNNEPSGFQKAVEYAIRQVVEHPTLSAAEKVRCVNTIIIGLDGLIKGNANNEQAIKAIRSRACQDLVPLIAKLRREGYVILPQDKQFEKLAIPGNKKAIFLHEKLFDWNGAGSLKTIGAQEIPGVTLEGESRLPLIAVPFTGVSVEKVSRFRGDWHQWDSETRLPLIKTDRFVAIPTQLSGRLVQLAGKRSKGLTLEEEKEFRSLVQLVNIMSSKEVATSYEVTKPKPNAVVENPARLQADAAGIDGRAINRFLMTPPASTSDHPVPVAPSAGNAAIILKDGVVTEIGTGRQLTFVDDCIGVPDEIQDIANGYFRVRADFADYLVVFNPGEGVFSIPSYALPDADDNPPEITVSPDRRFVVISRPDDPLTLPVILECATREKRKCPLNDSRLRVAGLDFTADGKYLVYTAYSFDRERGRVDRAIYAVDPQNTMHLRVKGLSDIAISEWKKLNGDKTDPGLFVKGLPRVCLRHNPNPHVVLVEDLNWVENSPGINYFIDLDADGQGELSRVPFVTDASGMFTVFRDDGEMKVLIRGWHRPFTAQDFNSMGTISYAETVWSGNDVFYRVTISNNSRPPTVHYFDQHGIRAEPDMIMEDYSQQIGYEGSHLIDRILRFDRGVETTVVEHKSDYATASLYKHPVFNLFIQDENGDGKSAAIDPSTGEQYPFETSDTIRNFDPKMRQLLVESSAGKIYTVTLSGNAPGSTAVIRQGQRWALDDATPCKYGIALMSALPGMGLQRQAYYLVHGSGIDLDTREGLKAVDSQKYDVVKYDGKYFVFVDSSTGEAVYLDPAHPDSLVNKQTKKTPEAKGDKLQFIEKYLRDLGRFSHVVHGDRPGKEVMQVFEVMAGHGLSEESCAKLVAALEGYYRDMEQLARMRAVRLLDVKETAVFDELVKVIDNQGHSGGSLYALLQDVAKAQIAFVTNQMAVSANQMEVKLQHTQQYLRDHVLFGTERGKTITEIARVVYKSDISDEQYQHIIKAVYNSYERSAGIMAENFTPQELDVYMDISALVQEHIEKMSPNDTVSLVGNPLATYILDHFAGSYAYTMAQLKSVVGIRWAGVKAPTAESSPDIGEKLWRSVRSQRKKLIDQAREAYGPMISAIPEDRRLLIEDHLRGLIDLLYVRQEAEVIKLFEEKAKDGVAEIDLPAESLPFGQFAANMRRIMTVFPGYLESRKVSLTQESNEVQAKFYSELFLNLFLLAMNSDLSVKGLTPRELEIFGLGWSATTGVQVEAVERIEQALQELIVARDNRTDLTVISDFVRFLSEFCARDPAKNTPIVLKQLAKISQLRPEAKKKLFTELYRVFETNKPEDLKKAVNDPLAVALSGQGRAFVVFLTNEVEQVREKAYAGIDGVDEKMPDIGVLISQIMNLEQQRVKNGGGRVVMALQDMIDAIRSNSLPEATGILEEDILKNVRVQRESGAYTAEICQNAKDATRDKKGELVVSSYIQDGPAGKEYVEEAVDNGTGALEEVALLIPKSTKAGGGQTDLTGFFGTGKYTIFEGVDRLEIISKNNDRAYQFGFQVIRDSLGKPTAVKLVQIRRFTASDLARGVTVRRIKSLDNTIPELDQMLSQRSWKTFAGLSQNDNFRIFFLDFEGKKQELKVEKEVLNETEFQPAKKSEDDHPVLRVISATDMPMQIIDRAGLRVSEIKDEYLELIPQSMRHYIKDLGVIIQIPLPLIRNRSAFEHESRHQADIQKYVAVAFYKALVYKTLTQTSPQFVFDGMPLDWETNDQYWHSIDGNDADLVSLAARIGGNIFSGVTGDEIKDILPQPGKLDYEKKLLKLMLLLDVELIPGKPESRTSLMQRRLAIQEKLNKARAEAQRQSLEKMGAKIGATPDISDIPHAQAKISQAIAIETGHKQMRHPEKYAVDPSEYSESEKEMVSFAGSIASHFDIEQVVLLKEGVSFAGCFTIYKGKHTFFLERGLARDLEHPGKAAEVTDTIVHELAHSLEARIRQENAASFWDSPYIPHMSNFTHDSVGPFAEAMRYISAISLMNNVAIPVDRSKQKDGGVSSEVEQAITAFFSGKEEMFYIFAPGDNTGDLISRTRDFHSKSGTFAQMVPLEIASEFLEYKDPDPLIQAKEYNYGDLAFALVEILEGAHDAIATYDDDIYMAKMKMEKPAGYAGRVMVNVGIIEEEGIKKLRFAVRDNGAGKLAAKTEDKQKNKQLYLGQQGEAGTVVANMIRYINGKYGKDVARTWLNLEVSPTEAGIVIPLGCLTVKKGVSADKIAAYNADTQNDGGTAGDILKTMPLSAFGKLVAERKAVNDVKRRSLVNFIKEDGLVSVEFNPATKQVIITGRGDKTGPVTKTYSGLSYQEMVKLSSGEYVKLASVPFKDIKVTSQVELPGKYMLARDNAAVLQDSLSAILARDWKVAEKYTGDLAFEFGFNIIKDPATGAYEFLVKDQANYVPIFDNSDWGAGISSLEPKSLRDAENVFAGLHFHPEGDENMSLTDVKSLIFRIQSQINKNGVVSDKSEIIYTSAKIRGLDTDVDFLTAYTLDPQNMPALWKELRRCTDENVPEDIFGKYFEVYRIAYVDNRVYEIQDREEFAEEYKASRQKPGDRKGITVADGGIADSSERIRYLASNYKKIAGLESMFTAKELPFVIAGKQDIEYLGGLSEKIEQKGEFKIVDLKKKIELLPQSMKVAKSLTRTRVEVRLAEIEEGYADAQTYSGVVELVLRELLWNAYKHSDQQVPIGVDINVIKDGAEVEIKVINKSPQKEVFTQFNSSKRGLLAIGEIIKGILGGEIAYDFGEINTVTVRFKRDIGDEGGSISAWANVEELLRHDVKNVLIPIQSFLGFKSEYGQSAQSNEIEDFMNQVREFTKIQGMVLDNKAADMNRKDGGNKDQLQVNDKIKIGTVAFEWGELVVKDSQNKEIARVFKRPVIERQAKIIYLESPLGLETLKQDRALVHNLIKIGIACDKGRQPTAEEIKDIISLGQVDYVEENNIVIINSADKTVLSVPGENVGLNYIVLDRVYQEAANKLMKNQLFPRKVKNWPAVNIAIFYDRLNAKLISRNKKSFPAEDIKFDGGTKGGIDFRGLPIASQPLGAAFNPSGTYLPSIHIADLDKEWKQLAQMSAGGMVPSLERINEFLGACRNQDKLDVYMDNVLACIAEILRNEEEEAQATEPGLRNVLVMLETESVHE